MSDKSLVRVLWHLATLLLGFFISQNIKSYLPIVTIAIVPTSSPYSWKISEM